VHIKRSVCALYFIHVSSKDNPVAPFLVCTRPKLSVIWVCFVETAHNHKSHCRISVKDLAGRLDEVVNPFALNQLSCVPNEKCLRGPITSLP
jgi:hypothetical protein